MCDKPPTSKMEQFHRDGYTVLEDFVAPETCDVLFARLHKYIDELDMSTHPKTVFSTEHQKNDEYFMNSQDKVNFYLKQPFIPSYTCSRHFNTNSRREDFPHRKGF